MGTTTAIQWCDHTFNPWIGCTKVSEGCKFCYAEALMDHRYQKVKWGPSGTRVLTSAANWRHPYAWNAEAKKAGERRRVFCASLADIFETRDEIVPWRAELFKTIIGTPSLDWLLLTKHPEDIMRHVNDSAAFTFHSDAVVCRRLQEWADGIPPKNVWLGTSVENQQRADERIPHLLKCPATVRFLSAEPLLGPIRLLGAHETNAYEFDALGLAWSDSNVQYERLKSPTLHWVIIGGESGPGARDCDLKWINDIRRQCALAGVACFVKQLGSSPSNSDPTLRTGGIKDHKGGDISEFPEVLRVREWPKGAGDGEEKAEARTDAQR